MHWFVLLLPLVALAGLAQIIYALFNLARRWRRLVAGLTLLLMLFPVWLLTAQGSVPRASTALLLLPGGAEQPNLGDAAVSYGIVRIDENTSLDKASLAVQWQSSNRSSTDAERPVASIAKDWPRIAEAALMPRLAALSHGIAPKPIVAMIDNGSNSLNGLKENIDVSFASGALKNLGVTFYRLKVNGDGMGGGRLELKVRGNSASQTLNTMSTRIDISLVGCRFKAKGDYQLQAWLDSPDDLSKAKATFPKENRQESTNRTDPEKARECVVVGLNMADERMTQLSLYQFKPDSANFELKEGFHEVRVELSFKSIVDGIEIPLVYRASTYIEVVNREVVIFSKPSNADDFIRHSWIHRNLARDKKERALDNTIAPPPFSAGTLLAQLQTKQDKNDKLGTNKPRYPFTSATVLNKTTDVVDTALKKAALLVLVEPTWAELNVMSKVVSEYAARGNSVLVVAPEAPAPGQTIFKWLPAHADPAEPIVRGDPRIYLLPDASRPASFFGLPNKPDATGTALQLKLFNDLAKQLEVFSPYDASNPSALLEPSEKSRLVVPTTVSGVLRSDFGKGGWSVVPPVFMRDNETTERTLGSYIDPKLGAFKDLAPSWIGARLGVLEKKHRKGWFSLEPMKNTTFTSDPELKTMAPEDLDLPLEMDLPPESSCIYPNTCIIVAALDLPQLDPPQHEFYQKVEVDVWMRTKAQVPKSKLPEFVDIKKLIDGGAKIVVVPIKLYKHSDFTAADGAYGTNYFSSTIKNLKELSDKTDKTKVELTNELNLDASDAEIQAVVSQILKKIQDTIPNRRRLQWNNNATARAVDQRTTTPVDVTFSYRPLRTTEEAKGIEPAATILSGDKKHHVLFTMPYDQGVVTVIGYNPFSFDRWFEDRAHVSTNGTGDGWGLQRLIDPVVRMTGNIGTGSRIESLKMSDDRRYLQISYRIPKSDVKRPISLPVLEPLKSGEIKPPELLVTVLGYDTLNGRVEIAVSVPGDNPAAGEYKLNWPESSSLPSTASGMELKDQLYISLAGQRDPSGDVRERLDRIAFQTGGAAVTLDQFNSVLKSARFDGRFLGACLLVVLTAVLLSPASRPWSNPLRPFIWFLGAKRHSSYEEADVDDEADALAALDSGGLSYGQPTAQRPAGPILQLRQMRPGDSAAAVPPSRWVLFVPEIAEPIGSPPLPQVYETPRPQAMSILTLLDLHSGADAHDSGAVSDRLRVMKRIAMLNAAASIRRGGSHRVASLQARENLEQTEAASPDQVAQRIAALRDSIGNPPVIPELLQNELVILVTDPASMTDDELLRQLARECGENLCVLTALVLIHPSQVKELGNRYIRNPPTLFDRGDIDSSLIERFHAIRTEQVAATLGIVESRTVMISCDQSTDTIAKTLEEEAWTRA